MGSDDLPRRYSREEMQRILEAASEPEAPSSPAPREGSDGFTLAEIKEIAGEVGIDPVRVERASRALAVRVPLDPKVSLGTYQLEGRLDRVLDPEEMRFVAQEADGYFGVEGQLRQTHGYLEWQSKEAGAFVGLVGEPEGTRIRVILDRGAQLRLGGGLIGVLGLFSTLEVASGVGGATGIVAAATVAAATVAAVAGFWRWRRAAILRRIEALLKLMTEDAVPLGGG